jgi:nickel-dependent lactate racemase
MDLKYGRTVKVYQVSDEELLGVLQPRKTAVRPIERILKESVVRPIGKPRLKDLVRLNKPGDVVIIVSDVTRGIAHYPVILDFLVGELVDGGVDEKNIEFVVALGTHRKHTDEEHRRMYGEIPQRFSFTYHDCHKECVYLGKTSTGCSISVNKRVRDADFVIATGKVNFHYLAGFSGGRKSVLPGISSYRSIRDNHCKLKRPGVRFGYIDDNIIAQEMEEAASLLGLDYLMNVIEDEDCNTVNAFWGDPVRAFGEAARVFLSTRAVEIQEYADCAIVSAGGYPQDRTFFKGHKALNSIRYAVRPGGILILLSQCAEGCGDERFVSHMTTNSVDELLKYPETNIEVGGHRAFVTAQIVHDYEVCVISDLPDKQVCDMHFIPVQNIEQGLDRARVKFGNGFKIYVVPNGTAVLPVFKETGHKNDVSAAAQRVHVEH